MRQKLPFLVPGLLYALLAVATFYYAMYLLWPAIEDARAHHDQGIAANRQNTEAERLLLVVPFYTALAVMILSKRGRSLVIAGAIISLPFLGGTAAGLLVLFWTLRYWPREPSPVREVSD